MSGGMMSGGLTWTALFLLGCYHGINPGMGWLFAVALGLQERRTRAVLSAIVPITLGHVASVAIVADLGVFAAMELPHAIVHRASAGVLLAFRGVPSRACASSALGRHASRLLGPRAVGILMSTAHGAGLMLLPFVTAARGP